jgi:starch-binding outer membrane protein, SusD/RagB family
MKTIIKSSFVCFILSFILSCNSLDISPVQILQDDVIFSNEVGINAFLYKLYYKLPIEDFRYKRDRDMPFREDWNATPLGWNSMEYGGTDIVTMDGWWPYDDIRSTNYLMDQLRKYTDNDSKYTQKQKDQWKGEAYFMRAYFYFALVKRKGGVPIIKNVQSYSNGDVKPLEVPRNTEEDCWNFIKSDLDSAILLMGESSPERGRANKYVAAALKSRAMLYAGSIAKYCDPDVYNNATYKMCYGLPVAKANTYFQASVDASKILEGKYSLYQKKPDLEQNYVDLFFDKDSPENIFVRDFFNPRTQNSSHNFDALASPRPMRADGPSNVHPSLNALMLYGEVKTEDASGQLHPVSTPHEFFHEFNQFEPRVYATFYFPGDQLRGRTVNVQKGIIKMFTGSTELNGNIEIGHGSSNVTQWTAPNGTKYDVNGDCGFDIDDGTKAGIFQRKYIDYNKPIDQCVLFNSFQSWIDMRYAEVLLNRSEASFELGDKHDAFIQYKAIRDRAGAKGNYTETTLTIDEVRLERRRELMFESHSWWDLRRWRIADKIYDGGINDASWLMNLYPYYVYDADAAHAEYKGKLIYDLRINVNKDKMLFEKKRYYEGLPSAETGKNPNLQPALAPGY